MVILTQNKDVLAEGIFIKTEEHIEYVSVVAVSIVSGTKAYLASYPTLEEAREAVLTIFNEYQEGTGWTVMK